MLLTVATLISLIVIAHIIGLVISLTCKLGNRAGMARITFGSIVNSVSGSIDEMVYATWKGIAYIRSKAKSISNPQSSDQMDIRSRVAECARYWYDTLTQAQRNGWESYAGSIVIPSSGPGDIIKPPTGPFSGYTAFIRNNILLFVTGQKAAGAFLDDAPNGISGPDAPVGAVGGFVANEIKISWTPGVIPGVAVTQWIKSNTVPVHAQQTGYVAVGAGIQGCATVKVAKGVSVSLTKIRGHFDTQCQAVDAFGQASPPSALCRDIFANTF